MTKRRRRVNPAKAKADVRALEQLAPPEVFERRLELRRRVSVALLSMLTVVLLSVSFAPFDCWVLAYVAMVPWMLALTGTKRGRRAIFWAWLAGLVFWGTNLYWLWWITLVGYFALILYLSVYWLVAALVLRAAVRRNMPMFVVLPLVWVALEYARAYVISGFPWFFLAHSQYEQTRLIQIADITGQYGVSFFVAMVNGALVDLLVSPLFFKSRKGPRKTRRIFGGMGVAALTAAVLLSYGTWRLNQETFQEGPAVAVVQCAFRNTLTGREASEQEVLEAHLSLMKELEGSSCDLVIVPESMLPRGLNPDFLMLDLNSLNSLDLRLLAEAFVGRQALDFSEERTLRYFLAECIQAGFLELDLSSLDGRRLRTLAANFSGRRFRQAPPDETLRAYLREVRSKLRERDSAGAEIRSPADYAVEVGRASRRLGCPILAGGVTWHHNDKPLYARDAWLSRNSALWFDETWESSRLYSKMHLVPFSEYVPFKDSWLWLHNRLRWFVPSVMSQLEPGREVARFDLNRGSGSWQLVTPICYEGTFARVCRALVRGGPKDKLIMANLSNDGWFVWLSRGGINHASNEHSQHLASYCFRAVENRVPVVRAVNTGISASIDSNGRILAVLERYGLREMVSGTLLLDGAVGPDGEYLAGHGPKVLVDSRVSLYSLAGDVFVMAVCLAAILLTAYIVFKNLRMSKGAKVMARGVSGRAGAALLAALAAAGIAGCEPADTTGAVNASEALIDARTALRRAAESKDPITRSNAIEAMADVMPKESGGLFLQALDDGDPAVRFGAAMAVGEVKYERAKEKLVKMAKDKKLEPDKRVLCAVVYALDRIGEKNFNYALGELLFDEQGEVRAQAAMVMGDMGEPSATGPLKALLSDEQDPAVLLHIHVSLAKLGNTRSRHLLESYTKGYFLDLRLAALPALVETDSRRAVYVLRSLLARDKSPRIRVVAAGQLTRLGHVDEDGYDLCVEAIRNPKEMMREAYGGRREVEDVEVMSLQHLAAMSLGYMKRPAAVAVLRPLLKSPDGPVRVASAMAIIRLVGPEEKEAPPSDEQAEESAETKPGPGKPKLHTAGAKD